MAQVNIPSFCAAQKILLEAELAAETESTSLLINYSAPRTLARAGLAILNLGVQSQRTGLGGKTVLELGPDPAFNSSGEVGEHGIRTGDIVRVGPQPKGGEKKKEKKEVEAKGVNGVVVRSGKSSLQVALDRDEEVDGHLWVVKLANDVTYKRMAWSLNRLQEMTESDYSILIRVLFGLDSPSPLPQNLQSDIDFFDPTLNESQKEAVRLALASREVALIHGPPGTGKTWTLIEIILQLVKANKRILVCGPSNISVDNIVERLAVHKLPLVRLGHPARLLPSVVNHSMDVLTQTSEASEIVRDIRKEMDAKQASIKKTKSGRERKAIYGEIRELRKDFREREQRCIATIVGSSKVVLSTLHGAGGSQARNENFDVVIIDEASQALEAQCWVALLKAKKVILAGDHLQLPPTIKSLNDKSKRKGQKAKTAALPEGGKNSVSLETTMFDRLQELYGASIKRMLKIQYRMNEKIMRFPSDELYEAELEAADTVKDHLLTDLPYDVEDTDDTREPLVFWDTQGGDFPEKTEEDDGETVSKSTLLGDSKSNHLEALLVKQHVSKLVAAGVHVEDIAVVTPYNAQLALLSKLLKEEYAGLELGSIDGFQGREKEAVVVSLVRSNPEHEVGFLGEKRRLNVAMTRPKRHLAVIADSETVSKGSAFLKRWMAFLEENADIRYPDAVEVGQVT